MTWGLSPRAVDSRDQSHRNRSVKPNGKECKVEERERYRSLLWVGTPDSCGIPSAGPSCIATISDCNLSSDRSVTAQSASATGVFQSLIRVLRYRSLFERLFSEATEPETAEPGDADRRLFDDRSAVSGSSGVTFRLCVAGRGLGRRELSPTSTSSTSIPRLDAGLR